MPDPCKGRRWVKLIGPFRNHCEVNRIPCALCGEPIDYRIKGPHRAAFSVDHIVPRVAGGEPLNPMNWQPAHHGCNSRKGGRRRTPLAW